MQGSIFLSLSLHCFTERPAPFCTVRFLGLWYTFPLAADWLTGQKVTYSFKSFPPCYCHVCCLIRTCCSLFMQWIIHSSCVTIACDAIQCWKSHLLSSRGFAPCWSAPFLLHNSISLIVFFINNNFSLLLVNHHLTCQSVFHGFPYFSKMVFRPEKHSVPWSHQTGKTIRTCSAHLPRASGRLCVHHMFSVLSRVCNTVSLQFLP